MDFRNPMGLDGFEFVEFASPEPGVLESVFEALGFTRVARHRSKDVDLFRQGEINFIINREPGSQAYYFAQEHGPSACGLAFRVRDYIMPTPGHLSLVPNRSTFPRGRWNFGYLPLRGSGARPCT